MSYIGRRFKSTYNIIYGIIGEHYEDGKLYLAVWSITDNRSISTRYPLSALNVGLWFNNFKWCEPMEPIKHIKKHSLGNIGRENKLMTE